jgi:hypothetical protein
MRRVDIAQLIGGVPIGGITVQVQVPSAGTACRIKLPPTSTFVGEKEDGGTLTPLS